MALIAGTVSVNADGSAVTTPNTLSKYIYEEFVNNYLIDTGQAMPGGAESVPIKKNFMIQANRFAAAIVTCIKATAEVTGVEAEGTTIMIDPSVLCSANGANISGGFGGNTAAETTVFSGGPFVQPAGNSGTIS